MELELDFSDHEELEFADRTELITLAEEIDNKVVKLAHSFKVGQALKTGIPVAIIGKTNVGKSTLLKLFTSRQSCYCKRYSWNYSRYNRRYYCYQWCRFPFY